MVRNSFIFIQNYMQPNNPPKRAAQNTDQNIYTPNGLDLMRLTERIAGCETKQLALQNGVHVPDCSSVQDFLAWRASREALQN